MLNIEHYLGIYGERERDTEIEAERQRDRHRQIVREIERQRHKETERDKDGEGTVREQLIIPLMRQSKINERKSLEQSDDSYHTF